MKSIKVKMDKLELQTLTTCINDARNMFIRENKEHGFLDELLVKYVELLKKC